MCCRNNTICSTYYGIRVATLDQMVLDDNKIWIYESFYFSNDRILILRLRFCLQIGLSQRIILLDVFGLEA